MNPAIYVSISTEPGIPSADRTNIRYDHLVSKLLKPLPPAENAFHIGLGLAGELGELFDLSDDKDSVEEFGDYEFYLQAALLHYGITRAECVANTLVVPSEDFVHWTGQLIDCIKREYIYNKPRELSRIKTCIAYLYVYLEDSYTSMDTTRQQVLQENANKLQERYAKLYYSDEAAQARADKN